MDPVNYSLKVPAIEKLIDYGASGVGATVGPMLAPWKAKQEAKARLIAAEADAKVREIEALADASALNIIAEAQAEARESLLPADADIHTKMDITPQDIAQSIEFQARKRLANSGAVLEAAADELGYKEVDDHEPDPDWTARFFDCVQDVSSEDMQKLWAKVLAGEVESPGRTSLRTLDTLRNMTKRDAEMFRDICQFIMGNDFLFYEGSGGNFSDLALDKLLHLQDCGLIDYESRREKNYQWGSENYILLDYSSGALVITGSGTASGSLRIPAVRLTSSGIELGKLLSQPMNLDYLRAFAKFLKSKDSRLEYLDGVERLDDETIRSDRTIPIEPEPDQPGEATP